jgi:flagellar FliL protein
VSELPRSAGKVLPLPQFVVNLADPAGKRLLKLGMEVEANADISKELQTNDAKIRDAVITLLAGKSFAEVQAPEGKVLLRAEVAARLNQILGAPKIVRVYFTEFVVD